MKNQSQQLQLSLWLRGRSDFWNMQASGQMGEGHAETQLLSKKSGMILQDLDQKTERFSKNRSGNVSLSWNRNINKDVRNLTASFTGPSQENPEKNTIRDQLRYYNQSTGDPLKDSINLRFVKCTFGSIAA